MNDGQDLFPRNLEIHTQFMAIYMRNNLPDFVATVDLNGTGYVRSLRIEIFTRIDCRKWAKGENLTPTYSQEKGYQSLF